MTRFTNLKIKILSETREKNIMHMDFQDELAVKLHAKVVEVGTGANGNP